MYSGAAELMQRIFTCGEIQNVARTANRIINLVIIIIIIKPRLTRHMSVTKEDESQARVHGLEIVYG